MYRLGLALMASLGVGAMVSAQGVENAAYYAGDLDRGQIAQVSCCDDVTCDTGCDISCDGCDSGCNDCGGCGTANGFGGIFDGSLGGECCLGDPLSLFGEHCGFSIGGWAQLGYHSANLPLFNSRKYEYQLHQAWVYAEQAIDTSCGFDIGGRVDYVYGTDAQDTQAFGIDNHHWDNPWDHGPDYGHAIPQAYLEAGYGELTFKVGKFFTIIGYEVVTAPDNFFYSHAYTMYNSEPFTHTGALGTLAVADHMDVYGGWVLGWDSGFEDNGDAYLGGASIDLCEDITMVSTLVAGRFADNAGGNERGWMHTLLFDVSLTDKLTYIFQNDILDTEDATGQTWRETFGINQYLLHTINDCWALGARFEYWNLDARSQGYYGPAAPPGLVNTATGDYDIFALTLGLNYKPHANVMIRPEIRWDWVDGSNTNLAIADITLLEGNEERQTTFGIDTIFLY